MTIPNHPFETFDWTTVPKETHNGETGFAYWQVLHVGNIRVRMVEYSPGYMADHWCSKGHIIYCITGSMQTTLQDGRIFTLVNGMTYHVGDSNEAHKTSSDEGCRLFIVD